MQNKTSVWAGGAAVVIIAIFAAAYFLLIGPVLDSTAETDDQRTQVEAQNQALRTQNTTLRAQFEHIDTLRAQLAVLHVQVPDAVEWDTFTTLVGDLANANGAVVTSLTGAAATPLAGMATATPDDATAGAAATATGMAIPVTLAFQGSPDAVLGTIENLQGVDQRLFLVQTVEVKGLTPSENALPPVAPGDVGAVINGYILVQPPVTSVPDQVPPPPSGGNPFVPSS